MEDFELYELKESNGNLHSVLKVPKTLPSKYGAESSHATSDIYNILMADISGSMWDFWPKIVEGWQKSIKDKLSGRTEIFNFGDLIKLKRVGTDVTQEDFTSDGTNDLTGALRTVRHQVDKCKETHVRVFIIADGAHDHGEPFPETEICQMSSPPGKTVSVFVFGLGHYFPVQHSIDIRSLLHNGNANIPYLFWAKNTEDIVDQIDLMGEELNSSLVKLKLNREGSIVPGLEKTNVVHLGEWLYFDRPADELTDLSLSINDGPAIDITVKPKPADIPLLLGSIFRQWNSVIIQQHRKKALVPHETFYLMEAIFSPLYENLKQSVGDGKDIKTRLALKRIKSSDIEFRTLMNQGKELINTKEKYKNEFELAEILLSSTVTNRKYDTKNLKLRGHSQEDFENDMKEFRKVYEKAKESILALPFPAPEDCCNVTITSTLVDLQDDNFKQLLEEDKFEFLKSFTMTGIPVYAPIRDSSQINPWTMVIKHVLVTPFSILSQLVLEESASANKESLGSENKDVLLQQDNEKTRFNAIIPIVPSSAAKVLKPIVCSNIYAMMATFCIMKNPHIVDYNAHLAALGCVWIKTLEEHPKESRPEFARERIENILATAKLYIDRPSLKNYINALVNQPKQFLMTESNIEYDGKLLKCESLVKATFLAYLHRDRLSQQQSAEFFKLVLFEYLGRCLSNYQINTGDAAPFTDFFCMEISNTEKKKAWIEKHCKTFTETFHASQGNLLERFFTLEDIVQNIKKFVSEQLTNMIDKILNELSVAVDMKKVKKLKNPSSCGDVNWSSLLIWAQEMGLSKEVIEEGCSSSQVSIYVCQALVHRNSKNRLSKDLPDSDTAMKLIKKIVAQENMRTLRKSIKKKVQEMAVNQWRETYMTIHRPLVMPLTKEEIIQEAQKRGVQVTLQNFNKIYRYNSRVKLLRNACQMVNCPHYLQPHNNFNQHISVEREGENFPHSLHIISQEFHDQGLNGVVDMIVSGKHSGTRKRKILTPPDQDSLSDLTGQMETLLTVYADSKSLDEASEPEKDIEKERINQEENEEFFDCEG